MMNVTFSGFTVDLDRGRLLADGLDVPLRPKSFELLTYLVRSAGRVVSKDELVEHVWRVPAVSDDSVNQCIRDIRRALGPAEGAVRTVRGRGYLFDPVDSFIDATPGILRVDDPDSAPHGQLPPTVSSIAVLPFLPVVPDARSDALSLGLTDSLIYRLSRSARLQVTPLSAVRRFADPERDPLAAGRALGVGVVVDGTLQLAAGRLRVGVRILRVADQSTLFADELIEDGEDVLAVQSGLAARLASLVGPELLSGEETASSGAFEAVLLAQYELARRTPEGLAAALSHYERGISLDPGYARAAAGMADLLAVLQVFGAASPHELAPRARAAAERAIALAPELADTHLALGMVKLHFDWDWAGAERHFQRAIAIQPRMAVAHQRLSLLLASIGSGQ